VDLSPDVVAPLEGGSRRAEALLLRSVTIDEQFAARGPFVINTEAELDAAYRTYRATHFGGRPWPTAAQTHGTESGRSPARLRASPSDSRR
jgi:quercetin 2,3-dioxygenase